MGELPYKTHLLLARARQRRHDGIGLLEHAAVHDAGSAGGRRPAAAAACPAACRRALADARHRTVVRCRAMVRASCRPWRARIPGALPNSCQDHGGTWQFMDQVVDTLRTYDTRWGYNGKRGNANDPSNGRGRRITTARGRMQGSTARLHHRHHRRPLRSDAVAGLERRDRRHAQFGHDRTLDQPRKILGAQVTVHGAHRCLRTRRDRREVLK